MTEPIVYLIILSYNGKQLTLDCLSSALKLNYKTFIVVLVDNASTDGSVDAVKNEFADELSSGKIILIENEINLGFAGGNNVGIKYAYENNADYVLLLNNDTVVDKELLSNMIPKCETDENIGIAGPKIYYQNPPDQIWFAGGEILLYKGQSRHIGIRQKDIGQFNTVRECDYITGCAMLIKRTVVNQVGYLDTVYPMYSEDADYCFRAKRQGFKMLYIPSGRVWHKISAAAGGQLTWKKIRFRLQSNFIFLRRHARGYHWFTIPFYFVWDVSRVLVSVVTGRIKN
ncbi:glycosyltransferase family 2 protein [bacterium]|nr:glycosyltransferase family 2 protein [bacterium]